MILILGGTTEGRAAIRVADEGSVPYYYSTKSTGQEVNCAHGIRLTGAMDAGYMETFCREKRVRLIVDAAHPFAERLHQTVATVASLLGIPVVRYERRFGPHDQSLIWCDDYTDAIRKLTDHTVRHLLALTGVNTLAPLLPYWEKYPCHFRILDREESVGIAHKLGFPHNRLVFYRDDNDDGDAANLMDRLHPDAILTKESGESGYFSAKVNAARQRCIPVFVVKRPLLPTSFILIYGEEGLRKQIERLLPGFYLLRSGYTTGTCATAAARAALLALLTRQQQTESPIRLPSGEKIVLPVCATEWTDLAATCSVTKDSGDDPDVTNGCRVQVTVSFSTGQGIQFVAGEGVGTVTLPGLGLEVGGPAINSTPRKMMTDELTALLHEFRVSADQDTRPAFPGLTVTLSVPGGKELAARTFNPKLGIVNGISILGTSGIVRPFSTEAFIASIRKEAEVAKAVGCQTLVINSGAKSERYLKARYPELPPQAFVHFGNFIGETIRIASSLHFTSVVMGIMIGKAVKLAEGSLDTHSKKVVMNKEFLKALAHKAGCPDSSVRQIDQITLARQLWQLFTPEEQPAFFSLLLQECYTHCSPLLPNGTLSILLVSEKGEIY